MVVPLTKIGRGDEGPDSREQEVDRAYYRSLTTQERFRMTVERSILLLRLANQHAQDRRPARLVKRR